MQRTSRNAAIAITLAAGLALVGCTNQATTGDPGGDEASEVAADTSEGPGGDALSEEGDAETAPIDVEPRTLTYVSFVPRENDASDAAEELMARVSERTGGAIEFETFYDGSLCGAAEISECVSDGRADIGYTSSLYVPSDFPMTSVGSVPFQSSNVSAVVQTMNQLYRDGTAVADEFAALGQELIYFGPVDLSLLALTEELTSIEDLEGRSLRATGGIANALEELGATAVAVDTSEQYESMQRGVIDGSLQTFAGHSLYRHYEVAPYFYDVGEYSGNYGTMHTVMNADVMASLEPELQDLIREVAGDISLRLESDFLTPYSEQFCTDILDGGGTFAPMPDSEDFQAWADEYGSVALDNWVASREGDAEDASSFAQQYVEILREMEAEFDYRSGAEICSDIVAERA